MRLFTISALVIALVAVPSFPGATAGACDVEFRAVLSTTNGPLAATEWVLYDLVRLPGSSGTVPPSGPAQNRHDPAKVELKDGRSGADGSISACLDRTSIRLVDGTFDLVLAVHAISDAGTVHGPGLVSGTVERFVIGGVGPDDIEPTLPYEAFSGEYRNVPNGLFNIDTFVPGDADLVNPPERVCVGAKCIDSCSDPELCVSDLFGGWTSGAFQVLALVQRGRERVHDLELQVSPSSARWPGNVDIYFPQGGCGVGCHYGGGRITVSTTAPSLVLHEYGHHIHAQFGGTPLVSDAGHACPSAINPAVAWTEGWADFFPSYVLGDAGKATCSSAETNFRYAGGESAEGNVVSTLWDLQDSEAAEDPIVGDPVRLWTVFTSGGYSSSALSFLDRWAQLYPEDTDGLGSLACLQTLVSPC